MTLSEIYVDMTFDAGHRVVGHKGKCARLHGHTYRAEIRAAGPIRGIGFVTDFGDIKAIVNGWDHRMLLWTGDPLDEYQGWEALLTEHGAIWLPFNPTAENMAQHLTERILHECDLLSVHVTLWETPKSCATAMLEKAAVNFDA